MFVSLSFLYNKVRKRKKMEKILAFHIQEEERKKLKAITSQLKIQLIEVEKEAYRQIIEDLLEKKRNPLVEKYKGNQVTESLIVMEGFTEKRLDFLLKKIRETGLRLDYKAVATPVNKKWSVLNLYLEMERERNAYRRNIF